ncbi:DUF5666 domain-containing protein [Nocardia sp. alder85J]|uniref:DUF5666 domain-containing protein n=1 Tax=Nocardia sp. alder85J TaxID=2862949 RepID=UPI001CD372D6|nr:DUF5666 domain-containing protein [Nocardia sp. alder85J]MCX4098909.1 DUF5666 domain-containing protein [Nocardia sp. alder85J]
MTSPRDPWQRPETADAPTERVGAPTSSGPPELHTSEFTAAYGQGSDPTEPYRYADHAAGPNATRELPAYGNQWGTAEYTSPPQYYGQEPAPGYGWEGAPQQPAGPYGQVGPTGLPTHPRKRRTGLWLTIGAVVFVLVVLGGIAAGLLLAGRNSSSPSASGETTRSIPSAEPLPGTSGEQIPGLPPLPGLGGNLDSLGATMGTIDTNDGTTLTLQSLGGAMVTVHTDDHTQVIALGGGKLADLHAGDMVVVQGDKSDDGSIMAKLIIGAALAR